MSRKRKRGFEYQPQEATAYVLVNTVNECVLPLKAGKEIGRGQFGRIWEVCENRRCDKYVAKVGASQDQEFKINLHVWKCDPSLALRPIKYCRYWELQFRTPVDIIILPRISHTLEGEKRLTGAQVIRLYQMLEDLHVKCKVRHGDVSLSNIFVKKNGQFVLGDWGFSEMQAWYPEEWQELMIDDFKKLENSLKEWSGTRIPVPSSIVRKTKGYTPKLQMSDRVLRTKTFAAV